jgi:ATP-binding cassette subfamily E protein 1
MQQGSVLGLLGPNGIGKSTALNILSGKLKPNFGKFNVIFKIWTFIDKKK